MCLNENGVKSRDISNCNLLGQLCIGMNRVSPGFHQIVVEVYAQLPSITKSDLGAE